MTKEFEEWWALQAFNSEIKLGDLNEQVKQIAWKSWQAGAKDMYNKWSYSRDDCGPEV